MIFTSERCVKIKFQKEIVNSILVGIRYSLSTCTLCQHALSADGYVSPTTIAYWQLTLAVIVVAFLIPLSLRILPSPLRSSQPVPLLSLTSLPSSSSALSSLNFYIHLHSHLNWHPQNQLDFKTSLSPYFQQISFYISNFVLVKRTCRQSDCDTLVSLCNSIILESIYLNLVDHVNVDYHFVFI